MRRKRWGWLLVAGLLLVSAAGWGAVSRVDDGDQSVDPAVQGQDPSRARAESAPPSAEPSPSPRLPPQNVLYLGDSLAMEAQDILGGWLERTGRVASYTSEPVAGVTLCDYLRGQPGKSLVPKRNKAAALVRKHEPGVVVLQFWGNTWGFTPCMGGIEWGTSEYYARYAADTRAITEEIVRTAKQAGIPRPKIVWVQQPPDAQYPERIEEVNGIYERQAAASGDLLADGGRELRGGDGGWTQYLPCNGYERENPEYCTGPDGTAQLHRDDDALHFCLAPTPEGGRPCPALSPGLVRYSRAVADEVGAYLQG